MAHNITNHQGTQGNWRYGSTPPVTTALDVVAVQLHVPAALPPGKRSGTHCTGGWMDPRVGLERLSTYLPNLYRRDSASSGGCGLA
jgi:hypothetical protein